MRTRAAGFCIYNDVALAVARARDAGHRVLYLDLDVHHGDGTQTLFWDDPEVLTFSIHETGHRLFPGTGMPDETGGPDAPGTAVNVPLDEGAGDDAWWPIVARLVPALAGGVQAHLHRLAARLRRPCPGPAGTPAPHHGRLCAGLPTHRRGRASLVRGALAGHRRWRLRRLPRGAPLLGHRVAGAGAPGAARGDAGQLAGALGGGGASLRPGTPPGRPRRCARHGGRGLGGQCQRSTSIARTHPWRRRFVCFAGPTRAMTR